MIETYWNRKCLYPFLFLRSETLLIANVTVFRNLIDNQTVHLKEAELQILW